MTARARQFAADVAILFGTLVELVKPSRPRASDFPFRCGRCGAALRRVEGRWRGDVQLFADRHGHYACDRTIDTRHHPNARKERSC